MALDGFWMVCTQERHEVLDRLMVDDVSDSILKKRTVR